MSAPHAEPSLNQSQPDHAPPPPSEPDPGLWLSERFVEEADPDVFLRHVAQTIGTALGATRVGYGEIDPAQDWISIPIDWTDGVPSMVGRHHLYRGSTFVDAYERGETLAVGDVRLLDLSPEEAAMLEATFCRSFVSVPLIHGGDLVGLLSITDRKARTWTPREIALVEQAARRIWSALQHLTTLTRLRESEEQFRTLAENMPTLCWLGGPDGRAYWGNEAYARFFTDIEGMTAEAERVVHPDDLVRVTRRWGEAIAAGTPIELRLRLRNRNGTYHPYLSSASPVLDAGGAIVRWCGILVDLSEKEAQDRQQAFMRAFHDATRDIHDAEQILTIMIRMATDYLGASRGSFSEVVDPQTMTVDIFRMARGADRPDAAIRFAYGPGSEPIRERYLAGRALVIEDVRRDHPGINDEIRTLAVTTGVIAGINVPLLREGQLVAVLSMFQDRPRRWLIDEIEFCHELIVRTWTIVGRARAETKLQERDRHQAFLLDWSDALRGETAPDRILAITLERVGRYLGTSRANFAESHGPGPGFTVLDEWFADGRTGAPRTRDGVSDGVHDAYLNGEVVVCDDVRRDGRIAPGARAAYEAIEAIAFVGIPLVRGGQVRAVLSVQQSVARDWRATEIQLLRDLAERTWVMLERARAEAALQDRERVQAFLLRWSDAMQEESSASGILSRTATMLGEHFGVSRVTFSERTADERDILIVAEYADGVPRIVGRTFSLPGFGSGVIAHHRSRHMILAADILEEPLFAPEGRAAFASVDTRAIMTAPLLRHGDVVAVLSVHHDRPRHWSELEREITREVAARTLAVMERAQSEARLAQSEALLAALMEHAPVAMHIKDDQGRYLKTNPEFAKLVKRAPGDLIGRHPRDLFTPRIAEVLEGIELQARAGRVATQEIDVSVEVGASTTVQTIAFPIPGGDGNAKTAGFTLDLTERKRAEEALARSREALYQTEKISALGSLLAGVSHELNNPLSIVVAQSVMMERHARGTEIGERAQKVRRAADRCARIVQTFLAMARQKRPERRPTDLNAIALAAAELTAYGLRSYRIDVRHELADGLPLLSADSDQLHQIIVNLIVNAQHAMADDAVHERCLTVRTTVGTQPGTVALEVADTGPGVPDEARRRIFEPFFTTKPQGQGTGVGLSFSQGLAEAHGGRLELVPTQRGALFRLTLPIDPELMVIPLAVAAPPPPPMPTRRALIIDDELEIAEALADFLLVEGYASDIADSGAHAQRRLRARTYDLVVSDIRMPDMDGPELHGWIARHHPLAAGRMGFATGDTLGAGAARFLDSVKRPVLEKPFTPEAVRRFLALMEQA